MKNFIVNQRYTIIVTIIMIGVVAQAFFMYKSATDKPSRNLVIVQKSPYRIIARWDSFDNEEVDLELEKLLMSERELWYRYAFEIPYKDYKFNENIFVKVVTSETKEEKSTVNVAEKSEVSNSSKK